MYGRPKVHKEQAPMIPTCLHHKAPHLPPVGKNSYTAKNSTDFVHRIQYINQGDQLISFDGGEPADC